MRKTRETFATTSASNRGSEISSVDDNDDDDDDGDGDDDDDDDDDASLARFNYANVFLFDPGHVTNKTDARKTPLRY